MHKLKCNITRKYTKTSAAKASAAKTIQRFVRKRNTRQRMLREESRIFTNTAQGKRLARLMKHRDTIKSDRDYLNAVCSDAGVCIAFGKEIDKIKSFFDGFVNFNYLKSHVKRMGKVSSNGFVKLLQYERAGYSANAILKSSAKPDADNLFYEYLVGMYINKQCVRFPCFVETYGIFRYISETAYSRIKDKATHGVSSVKSGLVPMKQGQFDEACRGPQFCSVLVQHIKNAPSLADKCHDAEFVKHDLLYVLFQLYMPLAQLKDEFTHYDLHLDNVLVYEPVKDNYIEYHYHIGDNKIVSFKSFYIAKIIDYGRSFFDDRENSGVTGSSSRIYKKVCSESDCVPSCGYNSGFAWLAPNSNNPLDNYYISSQVKNRSHDLRLLMMLRRKSNTPAFQLAVKNVTTKNPVLHTLLKKVKYEMKYGTPEMKHNGYKPRILNVEDAKNALLDLVLRASSISDNAMAYSGKKKLGDMYVYSDGRPLQYMSA